MEFDKRKMDFQQADRAFEELSKRRERGEISPEEFDAERQRLMVLDDQGRWWAKSGETGAWNYHDGKAWVAGSPPGYGAGGGTSAESSTETAAAPSAAAASGSSAARSGTGGSRSSGAGRRWPVAVLGVLVILALGGGLFYFLTRGQGEPSVNQPAGNEGGVEVPDLVGASSLAEARERAGDDFVVVESGGEESKQPIGSVVAQDQTAGESGEAGSEISVTLSKGVEVLEVVGNDRGPAVELLEGRLFAVTTKKASSPDYREGKVISQKPRGGSYAESRSGVTLTIGGGEDYSAGDTDSVPDVVGDAVEEARKELEDAGFEVKVETVRSDDAAGTVASTDPEAGTSVGTGAKITIKGSSGPSGSDGSGGSSGSAAGGQYTPPDEYDPPDSRHDSGWDN